MNAVDKTSKEAMARSKLLTSSRWLLTGAPILCVGGPLAVSWLIYVDQAKESYFSWPGILGLALGVIGLIMVVTGFFLREARDDGTPLSQVQHSGRESTNFQAGRDINIRGKEKE